MKYPQLVSTRAVNAISDWLVSRLEQLGVEAPQIYTRLLLSLLQSSVQINDPIEFSNLETFFANRKGNNRRHLPSDTDTLKKLNAVECLKEIVSSGQEVATIENLVDELCEKLKDIEKQSSDVEDDNKLLIATLSVATVSTVSGSHAASHSQQHQQQQAHSKHHNHCNKQYIIKNQREEQRDRREGGGNGVGDSGTTNAAAASADIETDPKKRYFRAFPALSKEMEDSFRVWRRNAKLLTWPVDRSNISVSSSSSSSTLSTSFDAGNNVGTIPSNERDRVVSSKVDNTANSSSLYTKEQNYKEGAGLNNLSKCENTAIASAGGAGGAGGVKRKSKRRRNQALSKGKTIQNIRKNSSGIATIGGGVSGAFGGRHYRHSSPTYWDTDFEGCWEMGRDLIKEFIVKQNRNNRNRNRSTSESAAYNMRNDENVAELDYEEEKDRRPTAGQTMMMHEHENEDHGTVEKSSRISSPLLPIVDISFCCDDEYDDTLASVSELATDTCFSATAAAPRRLYQREAGFSSRELLPEADSADEQLDFAQLKAKFNSSVEALWKDAEPIADPGLDVFSYTSSSMQMPALPTVAPFKENLKSFWTNYYNHHFDLAKMTHQSVTGTGKMDECASLSYCVSGAALHADIANTSDYYSMPSNLQDFDKSVGGACRDFIVNGTNEGRNTPVGVFLQNSIWSDNSNGGAATGDTDESFYYKVWNSNKKLTQLEALRESKMNISGALAKTHDSAFHFPSYPHSKWSEGINAGPHAQQQQNQLQPHLKISQNNSSSNNNICIDCTDSSTTASVSSTSCSSLSNTHSSAAAAAYNWQTPVLEQGLQADLQSWSNLNPVSLTEMYGGGGAGASSNITDTEGGDGNKRIGEPVVPSVTLSNHSSTSSGFIEYALIKTETKPCKQERTKQQLNYAAEFLRPKERYAEDENLLTSERTHFHPIKTYADGHTFDICSALDVIDYERSASGYLYLESDKYLEYTRNDNYLAEEDTGVASMNPLYAASNCEAANARNAAASKRKISKEFVIKFRLRRCGIACQTEDEDKDEPLAGVAAAVIVNKPANSALQHPLCFILSGASKLQSTGLGCNDAIEALNKAVAAAAKAAAVVHLAQDSQCSHWLPAATTESNSGVYQQQTNVWTAAQPAPHTLHDEEEGGYDEVDFCPAIGTSNTSSYAEDSSSVQSHALKQQWSMREIRKRCILKGHGISTKSVGHNNNNVMTGLHEGLHTLWGMCAACNKECKSMPANRLLRDELKLEADEIMSDLKYMQDLYIGRADDDDEIEGDGDGEGECDDHDVSVAATSDSDWEADVDEDLEERQVSPVCFNGSGIGSSIVCNLLTADASMKIEQGDVDDVEMLPGPQAQEMLQKVNRIIADLLRPDNMKEFGSSKVPTMRSAEVAKEVQEKEIGCGSGSLWCSSNSTGNDCSIWQPNKVFPANTAMKQMELLKIFSDEPQANSLRAEEDKFLAQLNWEHTNLAQIWQNNTPPATPITRSAAAAEVSEVAETNAEYAIYEKNCKNLESTTTPICTPDPEFCAQLKSPSSMVHGGVTNNNNNTAFERVQQFLQENAPSKLKLANRKRRHSASQNYFHHIHHHHLPGAVATTSAAANANAGICNNNNNNNSMDVADLNNYNIKLNSTVFADDINVQKFINSSLRQALINETNSRSNLDSATAVAACDAVFGGDVGADTEADAEDVVDALKQRRQTIITCKYWTTIDPIFQTGDIIESTPLSCLIDKNASILKHVTMVTRPLTR